jgi:membrane-associated protein
MEYGKFGMYNVVGGIVWITSFTVAGHFFGNLPAVKRNFQYVVLAIIVVSVIPVVIEFIRARRNTGAAA